MVPGIYQDESSDVHFRIDGVFGRMAHCVGELFLPILWKELMVRLEQITLGEVICSGLILLTDAIGVHFVMPLLL